MIDYLGKIRFEEAELLKMAEGVKKARDYYKKRGIEYYIIIAPNKERVYSEYMPEYLQKDRTSVVSRMDEAVEYLQKNTDVNIINFKETLENGKGKFGVDLYYPKDSHWNNVGAYIAFEKLAEKMRANGLALPINPLQKEMISLSGVFKSDLDKINKHKDLNYKVSYRDGAEGKCLRNEENGAYQVYENPKAPVKKSVMMVRDSFGVALIPYFDKTFSKNVFVHNKYNKRKELDRLVAEYQPDIMVDELVERYFDRFLKYSKLYGE